ncbi:MAG: transglycosylase SLT domain-containing protein [Pseudolabrys sp.]
MRTLPFSCLVVAFTIAAAYQIIAGKTPSAAPPEAAAGVEVSLASSGSLAISVVPVAPAPLLLRKEEAGSDALGKDQARLDAAFDALAGKTLSAAPPEAEAEVEVSPAFTGSLAPSVIPIARGPLLLPREEIDSDTQEKQQAKLEGAFDFLDQQKAIVEDSLQDHSTGRTPAKQNFSVLAYYVFSEIPPDKKPADTVLETLKNIPVGTIVEEIKRASDAFGVDFNFMKAVAKIESDFNPKQRTGSYIGLFQLSNYEFKQYGSGNITNPRDNAIAAAYKFATETLLFNSQTSKNPTFSDLYLIHQQGWQGAAEHVSHPKRIAWKSMCATDEGREKGERWCKRAIWGKTLPAIKHIWSSVDRLTSAAFVAMWQQRVDHLYSRYSVAISQSP